jgi:hypothetical protein
MNKTILPLEKYAELRRDGVTFHSGYNGHTFFLNLHIKTFSTFFNTNNIGIRVNHVLFQFARVPTILTLIIWSSDWGVSVYESSHYIDTNHMKFRLRCVCIREFPLYWHESYEVQIEVCLYIVSVYGINSFLLFLC